MKQLIAAIWLIGLLGFFSTVKAAEYRAAVYVLDSNNQHQSACVSFSEDTITALELLNRAKFNPVTERNFVVSINNSRAKAYWEQGSEEDYWSYWVKGSTTWNYARLGATQAKVTNGQLDGWQRGDSILRLPKDVSFNTICPEQKPALPTDQNSHPDNNKVDDQPVKESSSMTEPKINKISPIKKPINNQPTKESNTQTTENPTNTKSEALSADQDPSTIVIGATNHNGRMISLFLIGIIIGSTIMIKIMRCNPLRITKQ